MNDSSAKTMTANISSDEPTSPKPGRPKAVAAGVLSLGGVYVDCYVLEDGRRVLSQRGILRVLSGAAENSPFERFLARISKHSNDLAVQSSVTFDCPKGGTAIGREATFLVDLCLAYQRAFYDGLLHPSQEHIAKSAMLVMASFAKVGIEALVDEATGHQKVRFGDYLQRRIDAHLRCEADGWERRFNPSLVASLCTLYRQPYNGGRMPLFLRSVFAKIYEFVLGDDLTQELRIRNPKPRHGSNHHQYLQPSAQSSIQRDLQVIELLAKQSGTPEEFWDRVRSQYRNEPLQLGFVTRPIAKA